MASGRVRRSRTKPINAFADFMDSLWKDIADCLAMNLYQERFISFLDGHSMLRVHYTGLIHRACLLHSVEHTLRLALSRYRYFTYRDEIVGACRRVGAQRSLGRELPQSGRRRESTTVSEWQRLHSWLVKPPQASTGFRPVKGVLFALLLGTVSTDHQSEW